MPLTWTPPGADPTLAAVILAAPAPLTEKGYRDRLRSRIAKMVKETPEPTRTSLLAEAARMGGMVLVGLEPDQVAEAIVRDSEALAMATATDPETWPVPETALRRDREALAELQDVTLETFLVHLAPRE